jgi:hypothetical protein
VQCHQYKNNDTLIVLFLFVIAELYFKSAFFSIELPHVWLSDPIKAKEQQQKV